MKKAMTILGVVGAVLITLGAFFKFMHWPLAGILMTIGATSLAVYMLLFMYDKVQAVAGGLDKGVNLLIGLVGVLMSLGFMFKVQHWSGAGVMITTFIILYFLLVLLWLIRALNEADAELKQKQIHTFIWMLAIGTMVIFPVIINLRN